MKAAIITILILSPVLSISQIRPSVAASATSELGTFAIDAGVDYNLDKVYFGANYRLQAFVTMPDMVQLKSGIKICEKVVPYISVNYAVRNVDKWPPVGSRITGGAGIKYYPSSRTFYFTEYSQRRIYLGFGVAFCK